MWTAKTGWPLAAAAVNAGWSDRRASSRNQTISGRVIPPPRRSCWSISPTCGGRRQSKRKARSENAAEIRRFPGRPGVCSSKAKPHSGIRRSRNDHALLPPVRPSARRRQPAEHRGPRSDSVSHRPPVRRGGVAHQGRRSLCLGRLDRPRPQPMAHAVVHASRGHERVFRDRTARRLPLRSRESDATVHSVRPGMFPLRGAAGLHRADLMV